MILPRSVSLAPLAAVLMANPAYAADTVVVFPFELLDVSQDDELIPKVRLEETKRLQLLTDDLKARLAASKQFEIAPIDTLADEIKAAAPLFKCNGCETDLAKKSGAKLAMMGFVQKFSDTLLSVSIQVVDAQSGKVTGNYSAGVQGNTEEAWMRALGHIVKSKIITVEGSPQ